MKRWLGLVLLFTALSAGARAGDSSLLAAREAQALLGPEVWSRVIRVENTGSTAHYPRELHALIFEVAGMLWFYTDCEGTQNFSTHRGRLMQDRADFAPLLQEIHAGFTHWTAVPPLGVPFAAKRTHLRNACFIQSLAELRRRVLAGQEVRYPKILCSFESTAGRRTGHAVLAYETSRGIEVVDPDWPRRPARLPLISGESAAALSEALGNPEPQRARWVAVGDYPVSLLAFQRSKHRGITAQVQENLPADQTSAAVRAG